MRLALVAHVPEPAASDRIQVWLGVSDVAAVPALAWKLDGTPVQPRGIRPLGPALTDAYANGNPVVFTGFFQFDQLAADTPYTVEVSSGAESARRVVRTLPADVPFGPQDRFNVLLMSCFHRLEDKGGLAGSLLARLPVKPHLSLFLGDQVYLDLPTLRDFDDKEKWLGGKFQNDYLDNWFGDPARRDPAGVAPGFPQILALAPGAFVPDDHEYWNNYPVASPVIQNSWSEGGRGRWKTAAEMTYRAFQQNGSAEFRSARTIDIDPLSILLLDTRSTRDPNKRERTADLLGANGLKALRHWAERLAKSAATAAPKFGMLITGQSLFRSAVGALHGKVVDFELPDYKADYGALVGELDRITRSGLPVLCVTGDVHWGRLVAAHDSSGVGGPLFEVISSPLSLVSTEFMDQVKSVWAGVRGWFGSAEPWPRHADADPPIVRFGSAGQYTTELMDRLDERGKKAVMRGNHAAMLRFARAGSGMDVQVEYYPLHSDDAVNAREQWRASFTMRPIR